MIGLSRLKRAIEDVPTVGMQTGDPKVRLKLCDAQRIEVEFNAIIAERDNALAQNAELVAHILALSQAVIVAEPYVINAYKQCAASWADRQLVEKAAKATPTQHLRDRDAEVGRTGFVAGYILCNDGSPLIKHNYQGFADKYAESLRSGKS